MGISFRRKKNLIPEPKESPPHPAEHLIQALLEDCELLAAPKTCPPRRSIKKNSKKTGLNTKEAWKILLFTRQTSPSPLSIEYPPTERRNHPPTQTRKRFSPLFPAFLNKTNRGVQNPREHDLSTLKQNPPRLPSPLPPTQPVATPWNSSSAPRNRRPWPWTNPPGWRSVPLGGKKRKQ